VTIKVFLSSCDWLREDWSAWVAATLWMTLLKTRIQVHTQGWRYKHASERSSLSPLLDICPRPQLRCIHQQRFQYQCQRVSGSQAEEWIYNCHPFNTHWLILREISVLPCFEEQPLPKWQHSGQTLLAVKRQ
jgi:hypothetical protein